MTDMPPNVDYSLAAVPLGHLRFRDAAGSGCLAPFRGEVRPGQYVAVAGEAGSGKSALLALAAGLSPPRTGRVCLDGEDVHTLPAGYLRLHVGLVSPALALTAGTVEANIRQRRPTIGGDEVRRVAALCGLDSLSKPVATRGTNLSRGERERVALARALLADPAILLLDLAEDALGARLSRDLNDYLERYPGTVLRVTRSIEAMADADLVWYLEAGRLRWVSEPDALLQVVRAGSVRVPEHPAARVGSALIDRSMVAPR